MGSANERRVAQCAIEPWLASIVSFLPIVAFLSVLLFCQPIPLPTGDGLRMMPWWAPLGGVVGAFAVVAGLLFVDKVGAGAYAGLTITANILMSLLIDQFGWFRLPVRALTPGRIHRGRIDGNRNRTSDPVLEGRCMQDHCASR
jgi:bacterial/archaeal transporter family-2 protein